MIVAKLCGGMGNQMFQYAMARAMAERNQTRVGVEIGAFEKCTMRQYSLGLWKIQVPIVNAFGYPVIRERGLPYRPRTVMSIRDGVALAGYWQTEKYFLEVRDQLLKDFTPAQPLTAFGQDMQRQIRRVGDNSVFLTVRRTDYVTNSFHGTLGMSYWLPALAMIAAKVPKLHVFVFSDEPDWCKQHIKLPYPFTVAGNYNRTTKDHLGREDEELTLMASCQHAVMANSSYSWWGAWMGPDRKGGMVMAPRKWWPKLPLSQSQDVCPDRWHLL